MRCRVAHNDVAIAQHTLMFEKEKMIMIHDGHMYQMCGINDSVPVVW